MDRTTRKVLPGKASGGSGTKSGIVVYCVLSCEVFRGLSAVGSGSRDYVYPSYTAWTGLWWMGSGMIIPKSVVLLGDISWFVNTRSRCNVFAAMGVWSLQQRGPMMVT